MENELKVGEFIRTKDGLIRKVKKIDILIYIDEVYISNEPEYHNSLIEEDIVKHSPNLIDLIQCGDYVNGILVTGKEGTLLWTEIKGIDRSGYHIPISQYGENIKSVVTKEQFEASSYKVKQEQN